MPTDLQSQDCLTAMLVGLHYASPRFSLSKFFPDILDAVCDMNNFNLITENYDKIVFRVGQIKVSFGNRALVINSQIVINNQLRKMLPTKKNANQAQYIQLPTLLYGKGFEEEIQARYFKKGPETFRRDFISECTEMIKLIDKIVEGGLPPFRFIGMIEYYAIPLEYVIWDILEKFEKQAQINGAKNTEKKAINRYYFPKNNSIDERCLIFHLEKPDNYKNPDISVAGASFDFQYIPEAPKTINAFGGPQPMVKSLAKGIKEIIDSSGFMKFKQKELADAGTSSKIT